MPRAWGQGVAGSNPVVPTSVFAGRRPFPRVVEDSALSPFPAGSKWEPSGCPRAFRPSIEVLRRVGTLVFFGPLNGEVPRVSMLDLPKSIKITYAVFADHIPDQEQLCRHATDLFDKVREGKLKIDITERYPLEAARQAHTDIESRRTSGKLLLDPSR
ncbi:hypothetical protein SANTM175S_05539 [Streptomyces antimycoticus]